MNNNVSIMSMNHSIAKSTSLERTHYENLEEIGRVVKKFGGEAYLKGGAAIELYLDENISEPLPEENLYNRMNIKAKPDFDIEVVGLTKEQFIKAAKECGFKYKGKTAIFRPYKGHLNEEIYWGLVEAKTGPRKYDIKLLPELSSQEFKEYLSEELFTINSIRFPLKNHKAFGYGSWEEDLMNRTLKLTNPLPEIPKINPKEILSAKKTFHNDPDRLNRLYNSKRWHEFREAVNQAKIPYYALKLIGRGPFSVENKTAQELRKVTKRFLSSKSPENLSNLESIKDSSYYAIRDLLMSSPYIASAFYEADKKYDFVETLFPEFSQQKKEFTKESLANKYIDTLLALSFFGKLEPEKRRLAVGLALLEHNLEGTIRDIYRFGRRILKRHDVCWAAAELVERKNTFWDPRARKNAFTENLQSVANALEPYGVTLGDLLILQDIDYNSRIVNKGKNIYFKLEEKIPEAEELFSLDNPHIPPEEFVSFWECYPTEESAAIKAIKRAIKDPETRKFVSDVEWLVKNKK